MMKNNVWRGKHALYRYQRSVVMIRAGVLAAADPQQRGGLGHGAWRREDVPQDVPEEQELPQEEDQGIAIVTSNLGVLHRYCNIGS